VWPTNSIQRQLQTIPESFFIYIFIYFLRFQHSLIELYIAVVRVSFRAIIVLSVPVLRMIYVSFEEISVSCSVLDEQPGCSVGEKVPKPLQSRRPNILTAPGWGC
jgi:hypothetical protein